MESFTIVEDGYSDQAAIIYVTLTEASTCVNFYTLCTSSLEAYHIVKIR